MFDGPQHQIYKYPSIKILRKLFYTWQDSMNASRGHKYCEPCTKLSKSLSLNWILLKRLTSFTECSYQGYVVTKCVKTDRFIDLWIIIGRTVIQYLDLIYKPQELRFVIYKRWCINYFCSSFSPGVCLHYCSRCSS